MDEKQRKINFVENELPKLILSSNDFVKNHKLISAKAELSDHLDGFMSSILTLDLVTESNETGSHESHPIMVKLMKGSIEFRTSSRSYEQFSNEVFIYTKVIPAYKEVIRKANSSINPDKWIPKLYFGDYGLYSSLSDTYESILALENLKSSGFRLGPRLELDANHHYLLTKKIAEYHSVFYAMRLQKNPKLQELIDGVKTLYFKNPDRRNVYDVIYEIAFERFFEYYDRMSENYDDEYKKDMEKLRKYAKDPLVLMEKFRQVDSIFSIIQHGDYNRNNVLFKYPEELGYENPNDMRMIDFQELRYASPATDLSFYMYFNMTPELRDKIWDDLLNCYHDNLTKNLCDILHVTKDDPILEPYSYENFMKHLKNYLLHGAMISIQFLPWMMCTEEECDKLTKLFENDMLSKEFREYTLKVGGDVPNLRMYHVTKHASKYGYMKIL